MKKVILFASIFLSVAARADIGNGCIDQGSLKCINQPGFHDGQKLDVKKDLQLPIHGLTYFVDGQQMDSKELDAKILSSGQPQSYCLMIVASDYVTSTPLTPDSLLTEHGTVRVPANLSPFVVDDVSWYTPGVFISANINNQKLGFEILCGEFKEGKFSEPPPTSLDVVLKNFKGIIDRSREKVL